MAAITLDDYVTGHAVTVPFALADETVDLLMRSAVHLESLAKAASQVERWAAEDLARECRSLAVVLRESQETP